MQRRIRLAAVAGIVAFLAGAATPARAQDDEVVTLLQDLVRSNTSNPPGNEALVAELLRGAARAARLPGRDRADAGAPARRT